MRKLFLIIATFMGLSSCINAHNKKFTDMDVNQFSQYIAQNDSVQLVDVRTPEEYAEGHIAGAENIDWYNDDFINIALKTLDKNKPVAVYCRSGKRSAEAANKLVEQGYKVTNLEGGIIAWRNHHLPTTK